MYILITCSKDTCRHNMEFKSTKPLLDQTLKEVKDSLAWYKVIDSLTGNIVHEYVAPNPIIIKHDITSDTFAGIKQYGIRLNGRFVGSYRLPSMIGFLYFVFSDHKGNEVKSTSPCRVELEGVTEIPMIPKYVIFYAEK